MYKFIKMNGLGNSFVFFDENVQDCTEIKNSEAVKAICSPSEGIGADGVVFVMPPEDSEHRCKMQIFNEDGTEAEMCGNALRCVGHLHLSQRGDENTVYIETKSGLRSVTYVDHNKTEFIYRAEMGTPEFDLVKTGELVAKKSNILSAAGKKYEPVYVNVGNPHAVIFMDSFPNEEYLAEIGRIIETHPDHPKHINVEFVHVINRNECEVIVWERGCGFTRACGTGSCAVAAAGIKNNLFDNRVKVNMPGGFLTIEKNDSGKLFMEGPVQEVCYGYLSGVFETKISK